MKLLNIFNLYKDKISNCKKIVSTLPQNAEVTTEILEIISNNKTKLIQDKDIKNNYYFYLNDTIYLSDSKKSKESYGRILVIAHECIHSIQSKLIQKLNFLLSNFELVLFVIFMILMVFNVHNEIIKYIYILSNIFSILIRLILEIDAVKRSVGLSDKYLKSKLEKTEINTVQSVYKSQLKLLFFPFIIGLILFKIIRLIIVAVIG
jgi:Zn-dependent membrane protease YugP